MIGIESSSMVCLLASVQGIGLISAWLARVSEGSSGQTVSHTLFLVCLGAVGLATTVAMAIGPGAWLTAGSTLAAMILIAICDFRGNRQTVAG